MAITLPVEEPCPFCEYLAGRAECAFVARGDLVSTFMNLRQFERGALLVVPNRHVPTVLDLSAAELGALHVEAVRVGRAALRAFDATGLNIFQNNGVDAGQSVPHAHMHVVPRYAGSDPLRVFQHRTTPPAPFAEREEVAAAIRAVLGEKP